MASGRTRARRGAPRLVVRTAVAEDIPAVAAALTPADNAECVAMTGLQLLPGLQSAHAQSDETWAAVCCPKDGSEQVVALGGVAQDTDGSPSANVWLVCTPMARVAPLALMRLLRGTVEQLGQQYGLLYGYVDERNEARRRWIQLIGFRMTDDVVMGEHLGIPFRLFVSKAQ